MWIFKGPLKLRVGMLSLLNNSLRPRVLFKLNHHHSSCLPPLLRPSFLHTFTCTTMAAHHSQGSPGKEIHSNRLADEQSPYLLQHAHNPVDWYPWGEEAFAKAQAEDKPIFLSVGYSTCHWCHVMEVESFENADVAKLLNDWFVSIKVDREERPDVDKVYMTFVQATQGGGGWPMSVFLTPELKPIVGGTYFPPDDKYGRPGFKTVLRSVKDIWDTKKDLLRRTGDQIVQQLAEATIATASSTELPEGLPQQAVYLCATQIVKSFDQKLGGFGGAPKFPRPVEINLILRRFKCLDQSGKETAAFKTLEMALHTMRCMARGGIHDHIGGGFHRYSVDEHWHVPHFEKMLYDQGQLVNVYLEALSICRDAFFASVSRDVLDYLMRDMLHPEGGIYSAEDADSAETENSLKKKEGAFYIWTSREIDEVLGTEYADIFKEFYYVKPRGNCDLSRMSDPHNEFIGQNVLIERVGIEELATKFGKSQDEILSILGSCRKQLFERRRKRPRPHLDDKIITSWNGLAISAFSRASRMLKAEPKDMGYFFPVTGCPPGDYLQVAERAATFIRNNLFDDIAKQLHRSFRKGPSKALGYLDDYAFLIAGLLDLYEAGGQSKWLAWAIELQRIQDALFLDKLVGGYFSTSEGDPSILLRLKEDYDGAEPSGNSVAALNLLRLSSLVDGDQSDYFRRTAEKLLAVFENRVKELPVAVPLMCCAMDSFAATVRRQVVVVGSKGKPDFEALLDACHAIFDTNKTIIPIDPNDPDDAQFWQINNPMLLSMAQKSSEGQALAYVCQNFTCHLPLSDPGSLEHAIRQQFPQTKPANLKTGSSVKS